MSPAAAAAPQGRTMGVADLDAVMALEVRAYSHPWSRGNFVDSLAAGHLAQTWWSADALVGYIVAMPGVDELHLLNLTVAPAWQGRGHGSALLSEVLRQARSRQLPTVWLEVRASNERALALYARRGFEQVGLRRGYYPAHGGREDAVVMRLTLAGEAAAQQPPTAPAASLARAAAGGC
ncbi:MAG: ribosomal protein S18-alanine N-acetyltransferase [Rubrivivax sp.]|nr:ribosomal protein S18-alanine N-acetyltransferase [Rubrivivax sp.]